MQLERIEQAAAAGRNIEVCMARTASEIEDAQRLRYRVFAGEMGAKIGDGSGLDTDRFDSHCRHLIVRDLDRAEVVGTYRILTPQAALAAGGYYSELEFDMARLAHLRPGLLETGRACVHEDYRAGAVLGLLWRGLTHFMQRNEYRHIVGCASIGLADGGRLASRAWRNIRANHLGPAEYRVFPRVRLPVEELEGGDDAELPPLINSYFKLGAFACGEPAWDPDFNSADILLMLPLAQMHERRLRRFGLRIDAHR